MGHPPSRHSFTHHYVISHISCDLFLLCIVSNRVVYYNLLPFSPLYLIIIAFSLLQTRDCDFLTIEFSVVFRAKSPTPYTRHLQPQSWLGGQEAAPNKRRCLEASLQRRAVGYGRYDLNLPGVSLEGGEAMGRSDESHI